MLTESAVGWSCGCLLLTAFVCLLYAGPNRSTRSSKRPKWTAAGMLIMGFAFGFFGLATNFELNHSTHPEIAGKIVSLRHFGGKHPSSSFTILTDVGLSSPIHAGYVGPNIESGEMAQVKFVEYDHQLLSLTVLSGPTQGWTLQESDSMFPGYFLSLMGVVLAFESYRQWQRANSKTSPRG
jgi:hypothetical protein